MAQAQKKLIKLDTKKQMVEAVKGDLAKANSLVVIACEGLTVEQVTDLRMKLRKSDARMKVVKNSILHRATAGTGLEALQAHFVGSTAVVFAQGDSVAPVKTVVEFAKKAEVLKIKAGAIEGKPLTEAEVQALSKLPGKTGLLAKALGSMQAPASNLVGALSALARNLVYALEAVRKQKETAGAA